MPIRKSKFICILAAQLITLLPLIATAQEFTLKLHHFLPEQAAVPRLVLDTWADNVEEDSIGRIKVDRYPAMTLGGKPPELYDQVVDGVTDIAWTVVGYTPGRFPSTEVFELPFMVDDPRAVSYSFWTMYEESMKNEFSDVHMLGTWVHGPGLLHTKDPVENPSDLKGMKIRGGSRLVTQLLKDIGATPVGMPVPAVTEALSKGVLDGTTLPWEVTPAFKVSELVSNHTEFEGTALYVLSFIFIMNKDTYASLPEELQIVIDKNSGLDFSVFAGGAQADADEPAREIAVEAGNNIFTIDRETAAMEWRPLVEPIYDKWIADVDEMGIDGQALINRARELIEQYTKSVN